MDPDRCAEVRQLRSHLERRRVPNVVGVGLEGRAQHGDRAPRHAAAEHLTSQVHHSRSTPQVDRIDLA